MLKPLCDLGRRPQWLGVLLALTIVGVAPPDLALAQATAAAPAVAPVVPPAPGMGRIWIYRELEPFQSLARPYVRLNGAVAGISEPAGSFYRDVAPGSYTVTVDCLGMDVDQFTTVAVGPGQQVFVKILSLANWASGGGGPRGGGGWQRDTFYTWQIQPQAAVAEIARMPFYNGG